MVNTHEIYYPIYQNKDKFIILVTGGRGCEHPDTPVMMADLTVKAIKDIKVGEKVMGDDGTPRLVLNKVNGTSDMYKVHQNNADDYIVNECHILTVSNGSEVKDVPIKEYLGKGLDYHGYKAGVIEYQEQELPIDPYLLGLWLGDGTAVFPIITNPEPEIKAWLENYCHTHGQKLSVKYEKGAYSMGIVSDGRAGHNNFLNNLKALNLIGNKHIPQIYISNSSANRMRLLAGLLDTDGHFRNGTYEITQKSLEMTKAIKLIADSLGFRTHLGEKHAFIGEKDCGLYHRLYISGDLHRVPCKVERKKAPKTSRANWLKSNLEIEPIGKGMWCGIQIDGNHRYLHADGTVTHNSGKSFSVGTFIERLTFELGETEGKRIAHQILFTRYTMTSASISVIPEFIDKIEADGTQKYFHKTKTDIVNLATDSRVMFRGINTSSGNQTAKLKSIHGITTFVVDEAEEWTSEREFDTIMLSIRQKGLQNRIIIVMNPTDSNHFIYQRYIKDTHKIEYFDGVPVQISTHPNVLHIHTTYLDNIKHVGEQFIKEVTSMKEKDPEKYAHIVMGQWSDVAEGAVYKKWGIVDEFPQGAKNVARGLDFGFSHDPSACIKCGEVWTADGVDLYLDEQFYQQGMLIADLIRELNKDTTAVYSDSADPRLIEEIGLGGVLIYGVQKGAGSILAGIEKAKDYNHIFVTKRSYNLQNELRNYTWDKDRNGEYINQPIDANNHACDAFRYYLLGKILGKVIRKEMKNKITNTNFTMY